MHVKTPSDPLGPFVQKLQHWRPLSPSDQDAVRALPYKLKEAEAGNYIIRDGDHATHSCLLVAGFAFRQKLVADGGRSISAIHMRGDMVGLQNSLLCVADHSVQTLTACTLAFIPREALMELALAVPSVGMALWYDTLVDASISREWITNIARRDGPTASPTFCASSASGWRRPDLAISSTISCR